MTDRVWEIVERVIGKSSPIEPADAVLRAELRRQRGLTAQSSRAASSAVFAFYRWRGWVQELPSLRAQVAAALQQQERYEAGEGLSDEELKARAVPAWALDHVPWTFPWLRALQVKPQLWIRARPGQRDELAARLGDCYAAPVDTLPCALAYVGEQDLFQTPEFHAGEFELQDLSSQAVGALCAPRPGETWWDACAGEGGKLLHLSDLMDNKGLIWASDRAEWRLKNLRKRSARAKVFNYRAALWNGGSKLPTRTRFDGILVDAPCSGTGTWQRNPHARWTTTPEDVRELAALQADLVTRAAAGLQPGGRLIYAVCTLTRAETSEVVAQVEARCSHLEPCLLPNLLAPATGLVREVWLWPEQGGNGMFVAAWKAKQPK